MANNRLNYGFRWSTGRNSGPMPDPIEKPVADAYQATIGGSNVDLGIGDPVKLVNDGSVALAAGSEGSPDSIFGIIVGIVRYWDGTRIQSGEVIPGGSTGGGLLQRQSRVLVVPASMGYWEADVDENSTAATEAAYQALVNENVDHVLVRTTIRNKFRALPELDISSHATAAATQWRLEGISKTRDNEDFSGEQVKMIVSVNESQEAGAAATTVSGV